MWHTRSCCNGFWVFFYIWDRHSYKCRLELIYKACRPLITLLEQGNSVKVGSILPCKANVIHMEKTHLCLLLCTPSNRAKLDERVSALLTNHEDLIALHHQGLRMLLALKALLSLFTMGTLVPKCNSEGQGASSRDVAKLALGKSLLVMVSILKPQE